MQEGRRFEKGKLVGRGKLVGNRKRRLIRTGQLFSNSLRNMIISSIFYPLSKTRYDIKRTGIPFTHPPRKELPRCSAHFPFSCYLSSISILLHHMRRFRNLSKGQTARTIDKYGHDPSPAQRHLHSQEKIDLLIKSDVVRNRSHLLPFFMLAAPQHPTNFGDWIPLRRFDCRPMRDESDETLVGNVANNEHTWRKTGRPRSKVLDPHAR